MIQLSKRDDLCRRRRRNGDEYDMFNYYEMRKYELEVTRMRRAVKYDTHMHDELEIIYMYDGEQTVSIDGTDYNLHKGDCLAVFPNHEHTYKRPDDIEKMNNRADFLLIFIPSKMFYSAYPDMYGGNPKSALVKSENVSETAVLCFNKIYAESSLIAQLGWAQIIMSRIIPKLSVTKLSTEENPEIISQIMSYVSQNYTKSLTLDMLSSELGINKYYISRIFSKKIKMNFRNYIGILRSNHAAQLMNTSDAVLSEIAETSGFESLRSFFRVFHDVYGVSPAQYRDMVRKIH